MNKIKIIAKFEIVRQLKKPSFWIAALLIPILIGGIMALSAFSGYNAEKNMIDNTKKGDASAKISIIDNAGVINKDAFAGNVLSDKTKEEGIELIKNGEIDELYIIEKDFVETKKVESYSRKKDDESFSIFSSSANGNIRNILVASAASRVNPADIIILSNGVEFEKTIIDGDGEVVNPLGKAIIPFAVLIIFYILICVFGNRMLMAVVEEKENRISEMILTSVTAKDLIIGKIIALIALGFIQMIIFIIPIIIGAFIYRDNPMISGILGIVEFNPIAIIGNVALLVFSYFLFTGASTLLGSMMPTAREASQYIGVVIVGVVLPFMLFSEMVSTTPTMIVYILSYFPLSAPVAMMLRNAFGLLPWYEFVFGLIEIGLFSMVTIYLASKSFQKNALNFSSVKLPFARRKK
jgi:ABC-2 type transport system permease protein